MNGLLIIGCILAAVSGGIILYALLIAHDPEQTEILQPFAILPIPDGTPSTKAFLQRYASQIAWMDVNVLRCVLLVYPPEETETGALCEEMAREYECYSALPLPEAQRLLEARCLKCDTNLPNCSG